MRFLCDNQSATEALACHMARRIAAGDLIALEGDLGAGKSTFARAFVRAILCDPVAEVPSPTFTLVQAYEPEGAPAVYHADLYRLSEPEEIYDLGLEDERDTAVFLVEWPDRLPDEWRTGMVTLSLKRPAGSPEGEDEARSVEITGDANVAARLTEGFQV